jgi:PKD repeat protein
MKETKTIFSFLIIVFFSISNPVFSQTGFIEHLIDESSIGAVSLYAADIDNDEDFDVVGAIYNEHKIVWWRNDGGSMNNWERITVGTNFLQAGSVYAADFDGDGLLDIAGAARDGDEIAVWYSQGGDFTDWTKQTVRSNYYYAHEVYACDIDNDLDIDLLGASSDLDEITIWRNDGDSPVIWTEKPVSTSFDGAKSVCVADVDLDDTLDIVGAAIFDDEITWWRDTGGELDNWTEYIIEDNFVGAHRVQAIDMDGDGDEDMVGAAYLAHEVAWWRNDNQPENWTKQTIGFDFYNACIAHAVDIDKDGDMDVIGTAQDRDELALWYNNGNFEWSKEVLDNLEHIWPLDVCDLDNDGDDDIITASGKDGTYEVKWFENTYYNASFLAEPLSGHRDLEVQFTDNSNLNEPITSWAWDFNNDGTTDSDEQNPVWTYSEPGIYTVNLEVQTASITKTIIYENYIKVFDGESALEFDSEQSYAVCEASNSLNITGAFTFEANIKPFGWGELSSGKGRIIDKSKFMLYLINSSGSFNDHSLVLEMSHSDGTTSKLNTPVNSIELSEWQHIAATYDGVGECKIFINGIVQNLSILTAPSGEIEDNSDEDLFIGNNSSQSKTFDGIIDEVRIWSNVRNEEEIQLNSDKYLHGTETGLMAYWQMNEAVGTTINDLSENENSAVFIDAIWVEGLQLNPATFIDDSGQQTILSGISINTIYPNPFSVETKIDYSVPNTTSVKLQIFDIRGALVKTLVNEVQQKGAYTAMWNGTDLFANRVDAGTYFCRLRIDESEISRKIILIEKF